MLNLLAEGQPLGPGEPPSDENDMASNVPVNADVARFMGTFGNMNYNNDVTATDKSNTILTGMETTVLPNETTLLNNRHDEENRARNEQIAEF